MTASHGARQIGSWVMVLLLAAAGCWLLFAPQSRSTPTRPQGEVATTTQEPTQQAVPPPTAPSLEPLTGPAPRRAPGPRPTASPGTPMPPDTILLTEDAAAGGDGRAGGEGAVDEMSSPAQLSEPWSTPAPRGQSDLVDEDWLPSDHSGSATQLPPAEIEDTPSAPPPVDTATGEARRQLGQAFPRHLPLDAPGADDVIQTAQDALEQDLAGTPLGEDLQHVAALVLTPDPVPPVDTQLDDLLAVDVVLQIQLRSRMGTDELRVYRVTLTRASTERPWVAHGIRIV